MRIVKYKIESEKTMSREWHLGLYDTEQLHCAVGMVTEFGELLEAVQRQSIDKVNIMEEVGDVYWYLAGFQRFYNDCDWEATTAGNTLDMRSSIDIGLINSIQVLDAFKKFAFYGKPLKHNNVKANMLAIAQSCGDILASVGYTPSEARQRNIEKLRSRFPDKFDSHLAIVRDIEAERSILEDK